MKSTVSSAVAVLASAAVLGLIPAALAHGDDEAMNMNMNMTEAAVPLAEDQYALTYFAHPDHSGTLLAHIVLMSAAWVFVLPVGKRTRTLPLPRLASHDPSLTTSLGTRTAVMLSLARSRYTLLTQAVFLATNGVGLLLGTIYNASTPDLYPNNAHHKLGWLVTWMVCTQALIGLLGRVAGAMSSRAARQAEDSHECQSFIPMSTEAMAEHESRYPKSYRRISADSGQGTERSSESVSGSGSGSGALSPPIPLRDAGKEYTEDVDLNDDDDDLEARLPASSRSGAVHRLAKKVSSLISSRAWKALLFVYNFVDRTILILGSITLATGVITYGRFFVSRLCSCAGLRWALRSVADNQLPGGRPNPHRAGALD
jgi:hypothetical protein